MASILEWLGFTPGKVEIKSDPVTAIELPQHSIDDIRAGIAANEGGLSAIQISAVYACARVIAEGLAQVPCALQRTARNGGREHASDHPLYNLLRRRPNSFQTSFEFREQLGFQLALTGNAFVFVSRNSAGQPIELIPLAKSAVRIEQTGFGEYRYRLGVKGLPLYSENAVWHLRGPSLAGVEGLNVQAIAANAIGLSADLEGFGANLFRNGSRPSGMLTTDQTLSTEQHAMLVAAWNAQQSGIANAHKTAILSAGLKFQTIQTTANEAQFIEARRYQIEEICRIMRVDPIMIGQATNAASYASIEQRFLAHMTHTIGPWHSRFEESAEAALLSADELRQGYSIALDNRSMLRGSAIDRANYYAVMRQNGLMSTNECRDFEGLDRDDDPASDLLTPAANLFGSQPVPPA